MHIEDALRQVLLDNQVGTQEEIAIALERLGFSDMSQSKISRLLRKSGATKAKNACGQLVYCLPKEPAPPVLDSRIDSLAINIVSNETMVIVHTSPGSAQLLGRILDHRSQQLPILGTIAGDDCLLVIPTSVEKTATLVKTLKELLYI